MVVYEKEVKNGVWDLANEISRSWGLGVPGKKKQ